jgi:flagellar biosynthesis/type III secretory pathway M-ring protein FliF/YscJ
VAIAGRLPLERLAAAPATADDEGGDEQDAGNSLRARFQHSGRSLRDELSELIKEDPDAAANVLQNWIGDAA